MATYTLTEGDDFFNAPADATSVEGLGGSDSIDGFALATSFTIDGGDGNDSLNGGTGGDTLIGGDGDDRLWGRQGSDKVDSGDGNDTLRSTAGDDKLIGGAGDDSFLIEGSYPTSRTVIAYGGFGNDSIDAHGSYGPNVLYGGDGLDTIFGGDGNETLLGGSGDDRIEDWHGDDSVVGGSGNDTFRIGPGKDTVRGGEGNDTFEAVYDFDGDTLYGDGGDDVFRGVGSGPVTIYGGAGFDVVEDVSDLATVKMYGVEEIHLAPGPLSVRMWQIEKLLPALIGDRAVAELHVSGRGGSVDLGKTLPVQAVEFHATTDSGVKVIATIGDDTLSGSAWSDTFSGGSGNDSIDGGGGNDKIFGGDGDDTLATHFGNSSLYGGSGDDWITFGSGDNLVYGGDGNDMIVREQSASGNNTLYGGSGDDTFVIFGGYEHESGVIRGGSGYDVLEASSDIFSFEISGVEELHIFSGYNVYTTIRQLKSFDHITPTGGSALVNINLVGDGGAIDFGAHGLLPDGMGVLVFAGSSGHGATTSAVKITGTAATDYMIGSQFGDTLRGQNGDDELYGQDGDDVLGGGAGNDLLQGEAGHDRLYGGKGNDTLDGGGGSDLLDGGKWIDTMMGGAGDDTYVVENRADVVREAAGEGTDTVQSSLAWALGDNFENLQLTGTREIWGDGNAADNVIIGNDGTNVLAGKDGNDTLSGGLGADRMWGDAGDDAFLFDSTLGNGNVDRIMDFGKDADTILLDHAVFKELTNGKLDAAAFLVGSLAGETYDTRIVYESFSGALYYDADGSGDGKAVLFATLTPGLSLSADDFEVV